MNPKHDPLFDLSIAMAGMEHDRMTRENEELQRRVEALEHGEVYVPSQPRYTHQSSRIRLLTKPAPAAALYAVFPWGGGEESTSKEHDA